MGSLVGRDRGNSHWDQEEKVWGRSRPVVQQGGGILALREVELEIGKGGGAKD